MDAASRKFRILVVEESLLTVEQLAEIVRSGVSDMTVALTAAEGAAVAQLESDAIDLLILDLNLNKGSGFNVLRAAKSLKLPPAVVVLTTPTEEENRRRAKQMGADYFLYKESLSKESGIGTLASIVRSVAEQRIPGMESDDDESKGESSDKPTPMH